MSVSQFDAESREHAQVMDGSGKRPLVSGALIKALRKQILARGEGENLGSEGELLQRLKVGRSTLRQAARLLEQEQLLDVRRGVRGGYFTRRPDETAVAQAAALYLSLRRASLKHMLEVTGVLNEMASRLAAASQDEAQREVLRATLDQLRASARSPMDVREFLARGDSLRRAVAKLAGNPFLELFLGIAYLFGGQAANEPIFTGRPDRMAEMEPLQLRMAESVLKGEPEVAAALRHHASQLLNGWAREDGDPALRTIGGE
jgi:GntR family transcriptional regulator, transcriptional repressor for pyruvate dehydrogenase complex